MTREEPYNDEHRHDPSHFCEAVGGRVHAPKSKCALCDGGKDE